MKTSILLVFMSFVFALSAQQPQAYELFNSEGKKVTWETITNDIRKQDLVLFGELHNNAIAHWLQLELTEAMHQLMKGKITLGAEMFEADNQLLIDEYFAGLIAQKNFEKEARLWDNYKTDYKPLLEFARSNDLDFIATNIPRRYAALVNKKGFEALQQLSVEAKKWLPPLPVPYDSELPGYQKMQKMARHMPGKKGSGSNLAKAQAIKDATMAHFIIQNLKKGSLMLHFNGRYHSDHHEGIVWYVKKYAPETRMKTISTVKHAEVTEFKKEYKGVADYVIVVNEQVTNTY